MVDSFSIRSNKNINMSSVKSSENIQKKEVGPDRNHNAIRCKQNISCVDSEVIGKYDSAIKNILNQPSS